MPTTSDGSGFEPFEVSYSYDQVGRITAATGTGTVDGSYSYGSFGSSSSPAHGPLTAGSNTYSYDGAGNRVGSVVDGQSRSYGFDVLSRLVSAGGDVDAVMLYDAAGARVRRTVDGETTWYLSNGLEIDEAGTEKISLGAVTYSDGGIWAHNLDHLGTPGYTVSWATGVETFRRFTPFGSPRSASTDTAVGASDLTFTGQRDDGSLDLMYYGGRFYDPLVGQFTRPDPLSVDGPNRFAYVRNNPVIGTDPSGLCTMISGELTCGSNSKVYGGFRGGRDDSSTGRYENYTYSKSRDKVPTATAAYVPASPVVVDRAVTAAVVELGVGVVVGVGCVSGSALTGFTAAFGCGAVGASAGGAAGNLVAGRDVTDGVVQDAVVGGVGGGLGYAGGRLASSVVDDVADTIFTQYRPPAPNSTAGMAGGVTDHVVLGKSIGLDDQAMKIGGRHLMESVDWQADVLAAIADRNTRISLALDGLEGAGSTQSRVMAGVQRASSGRERRLIGS